jgi:hypothetical protein
MHTLAAFFNSRAYHPTEEKQDIFKGTLSILGRRGSYSHNHHLNKS